ncbi:mycofactocin-coupled SDR family oxidoreductase [Phycicoccus sp. Soil802]|uniref:mycofactocin-coupled SDR family oxidoreductase n=1 Tax=Phycicoccus sp. Soil802 TaxID=1736414 RepID=UPI001F1CDD6E|nr:mycofactocin-coupled SDR family oxidoreductase [Phycicoccus sp. Soil802]
MTGAARGIGAATVRRLARDGYAVLALDWCVGEDVPPGIGYPMATPEELNALAAEFPGQLELTIADVRDRASLRAAVTQALDRWGRLDCVVAAAAIVNGGGPLWESSQEDLDLLWDIDVRGVWNTAAETLPVMLGGPNPSGGRFVAVASAAGTRGLYRLGGYGMAKHAVVGLVKGLAADLVGTGVTAAAVSPGSTRTAMLSASADLYDLNSPDQLAAHQLLKRLLDPEEVAAAIAFCCSLEGAVVNGSVLHADGGFHA